MSGTISYDHSPDDTVWVVSTEPCVTMKHGTVSAVTINVVDTAVGSPPDPHTTWYDIFLDNNEGEITIESTYVYAQADKAAALTFYGTLIEG